MEYSEDIRFVISTSLAEGKSNQEIIELLCKMYEVTEEEIVSILRLFYDNWQNVVAALNTDAADYLNWHIYMRHQALQIALKDRQSGGALSILDSLAKLQGLSNIKDDTIIPITIELVPKEEEKHEDKPQSAG